MISYNNLKYYVTLLLRIQLTEGNDNNILSTIGSILLKEVNY